MGLGDDVCHASFFTGRDHVYRGELAPLETRRRELTKELDVQGSDVSDCYNVGGQQLANPAPTVVDMIVSPMMITATTGTVVQTKAMCKYSDGSVADCTNKATFTYVRGGVAAYNGTGALVGTQAGPAEVDVSMAAITVKLSVLIVDLPIYFNGGLMLGSN